jgi:hypothetical protein
VFGSHQEGQDPTESFTTSIELLFNPDIGEDTTINPYPINLKVVSYIVFSIVGASFVVIIIVSYQSRSKL